MQADGAALNMASSRTAMPSSSLKRVEAVLQ